MDYGECSHSKSIIKIIFQIAFSDGFHITFEADICYIQIKGAVTVSYGHVNGIV